MIALAAALRASLLSLAAPPAPFPRTAVRADTVSIAVAVEGAATTAAVDIERLRADRLAERARLGRQIRLVDGARLAVARGRRDSLAARLEGRGA